MKKVSTALDDVLKNHAEVFEEGIGTMKSVKAKLRLKEVSVSKCCKPCSVPFALRAAIERDSDRLEGIVVLEIVNHSQWASPIIPIVKSDNSIRICGDYKVTVHSMLNVDQFPLPNLEELFVTLSGGQKYSKLDISQAYQQILLDEESQKLVTINTHKGLYRPTCLPCGVALATPIFQRSIERILRGSP